MLSDEQLVIACLNGSEPAFSELVERYQQRLLRFLLSRAACRADAEDALQDAFLNAHRYLESFNPRWRFSTWLYRIALRTLARQQQSVPIDDVLHQAGGEDPLQACIRDSERDNVWLVAKARLDDAAFTAMWFRYVEDMSVREVAETLQRTVSWTKVTLFRSRRTLSAALADEALPRGGPVNEGI